MAFLARIHTLYVITLLNGAPVFVCFQSLDLAYVKSSAFLPRAPISKCQIRNLYDDFIVGCGAWTKETWSYFIKRVPLIHPT